MLVRTSAGGRLCLLTVALAGLMSAPARAHDSGLPARLTHVAPLHGAARARERKLRALETAVLGASHAAEHAKLRAFERSPYWQRRLRAAARRASAFARRQARLMADEPLDHTGLWTDSVDPSQEFDIPVFAINSIVLPTGKVLWFAYPNHPDRPPGERDESNAWLWDPSKGIGASAFEQVNPPIDPATGKPVNIWCGGNSLLADGEVLVTGGNLKYYSATNSYEGLKHVYTFDPFTERWRQQPDMRHGRWYPSQLLMPDGRTLIMGGLDETGNGTKNPDLELFTPGAGRGALGTISFLGPPGVLGSAGEPPIGDYYPHLFWMPSGHGLVAGPYTNDSWWFTPPGRDTSHLSWQDLPNSDRSRVWGTAVMLPGGADGSHEVEQLGGSDVPAAGTSNNRPAVASTVLFDERDPGAGWQPASALNEARSHANTVLLPDGTMVEVGGGLGSVEGSGPNGAPGQWAADPDQKQIELWDPVTRDWRLGPAQKEYRTYHSTAVLLPDGRVVSAGDDYNGRYGDSRDFTQDSAEIYEPPYLFDGDAPAARPAIARAPSLIAPGERFDIATDPSKPPVTRAVLMAPGAATHAVDMNQRYVPLAVTSRAAGRLSVVAPPSVNVAPPGYYMLFVLDAEGTPSTAAWVRLVPQLPAAPVKPAPVTPAPPAAKPEAGKPKVRARLVRRGGRRRVQVSVGRWSHRHVRVRVVMRDRRRHAVRRLVRTLRTGHTTTLRARVARRVRSVRAVAL